MDDIRIIFLLLAILSICSCFALRNHQTSNNQLVHQYWFVKDHPVLLENDDRWYYCDYKCLTLEKLNNNKDFVVISFTAPLKEMFSSCYVKIGESYTLWSKVAENKFFQKHCGEDYKDWIAQNGFKVAGIYGKGIGTMLTDEDIKQMYKK